MRAFIPGIALLLVIGPGLPAAAEIYRWTDGEGRVHFTQRLDQVPPEHRAAARRGASAPPSSRVQTYGGSDDGKTPPAARRRARIGRELRIPFERDGTLMRVNVRLNDQLTAPFYIDTGASGVSVPAGVIERLGVPIGPNTRTVTVMTAAGLTARPVVVLDAVEVGGARVEGLEATVNPAMHVGLLGGSFFNNFVYRVDAAEGVITLAPNDGMRAGMNEQQWRGRFQRARDTLALVDAYLDERPHMRPERRAPYEARRASLQAELEEIAREADRFDVPHGWRR